MKNIFFFFAVIFGTFSFCQDHQESSLLWRISGNDLSQPSFLFGTIHMIPKKDYFFNHTMKSKLDSCSALMMEMKMDIGLKDQLAILPLTVMPSGKTYKDYMKEEEYHSSIKYLADTLGWSEKKITRFQRLKPFFSSALIYTDLIGKYKIYEKELNKKAKKSNMELLGFETLHQQVGFVNQLTIEEQFESSPINSSIMTEYYGLLSQYKKQDLNQMWSSMIEADSSAFDSKFYQILLVKRNLDWIPKLETQAKSKATFFAVGAAHLCGPSGLISLLRKKGYTVEAVKN